MKTVFYRLYIVWVGLFVSLSVHAGIVTRQQALETARKVWTQTDSRAANGLRLWWTSEQLMPASRQVAAPAFYVFAPDKGTGFVIVSGDDSVESICAYSFDSAMPEPDNLPMNFKAWVLGLRENILYCRDENKNASSYSRSGDWLDIGEQVVMLRTPLWNQDSPFNGQTPLDGDVNSLAGCTAVSLAMVMRYYQWPEQGIGSTEAYTTETKQISVPARNLEEPYQWDKMRLTYLTNRYSAEEAEAVARLIADVGAAMQADFTAKSTGASALPSVLSEKFDYHPGMYYVHRDNYTQTEWIELMKGELILKRPVWYSAFYSGSGHAMVLDGYTTNDYFHVNWGWSGYCDGFYSLYELDNGENNFDRGHSALLKFIPNDGTEIENHLTLVENGLTADCTEFVTNNSFNVLGNIANLTGEDFSGKIRLSVTDADSNVKENLYESETIEQPCLTKMEMTIPVKIQQDIAAGDRIRLFYKHTDSNKWYLVQSEVESVPWEIVLSANFSIAETTSVTYDKTNHLLTIKFMEGVQAVISLNGEEVTEGITIYDDRLEFNTRNVSEGAYLIRLSKDMDVKEFTFEVKSL